MDPTPETPETSPEAAAEQRAEHAVIIQPSDLLRALRSVGIGIPEDVKIASIGTKDATGHVVLIWEPEKGPTAPPSEPPAAG